MITESERRDLLLDYVSQEPTVRVNCVDYLVSVEFRDGGPIFYAVDKWGTLYAVVIVTKETWDLCNCGLAIAYVLNCVLDRVEWSVLHYSNGLELVA